MKTNLLVCGGCNKECGIVDYQDGTYMSDCCHDYIFPVHAVDDNILALAVAEQSEMIAEDAAKDAAREDGEPK